jgi:hypothetical protein
MTNRIHKSVAFLFIAIAGMLAVPRLANALTVTCTVTEVLVFPERVHVRCATPTRDPSTGEMIVFLAISTSDATFANRFLSVATSAIVSGRRFLGDFVSGDTSGADFGCGRADCRKIGFFGIN